jgi:hypothetical protein
MGARLKWFLENYVVGRYKNRRIKRERERKNLYAVLYVYQSME